MSLLRRLVCRLQGNESHAVTHAWQLALSMLFVALTAGEAWAVPVPQAVKSLAAWYDASDSTTMTTTSTVSLVSQLSDKSGNGETLASPFGSMPTYNSNGINGLGGLQFSGGQYLLSNDASFSRLLLPTSTVFIVQNTADSSQASTSIFSQSGSLRYNIHLPWQSWVYLDFGDIGGNRVSVSTGSAPVVGSHIFTAVGTEGGNRILNDDGATIASGSLPNTGETFSCPVSIAVGQTCGNGFGSYFTGTIGEVIVYNAALSQASYQTIEGALACKWGLQSNLPAGHPWKSACPSGSESSNLNAIAGLSAWYDASDATTITGAPPYVLQWNDKSGNGETLASPSSYTPAYLSSEINGLGSLQFSGNQYLLSNDASFSRLLLPASTVFIVQNAANSTQASTSFFSQSGSCVTTCIFLGSRGCILISVILTVIVL
jgi:hypothetical protein